MSLKINFELVPVCKSRRRTYRSAGNLFFVRSSRFHSFGRPALTCPGQFQPRHPQQVVGARHKVTPRLRAFCSPIPAAPQAANHLDPTDDFFNPFANHLADPIGRAARRSSVQSGSFDFFFARDVRNDLPLAAVSHKGFAVIVLIGTNAPGRDALMKFLVLVQLTQGRHRLRLCNRIVNGKIGAQTVSIFHQQVRAKTQSGLLATGLAIQNTFRVARALMRVVAAWLAPKVDRRIAGILVLGRRDFLCVRAVLADKTFQTGPRFNQGTVGGEVFVARPAFFPREVIDFGEEQFRHVRGEHALIVLGKNAVVKAAFIELAVKEPKPKQIVTELFAEEPFTADAVKRGEHTGLEQLFGRNAATTFPGVKFIEKWGKLLENGVHPTLDRAQRMVGRDALVEIDDGQKVRLGLGFSTHDFQTYLIPLCSTCPRVFQQPARIVFSVFY